MGGRGERTRAVIPLPGRFWNWCDGVIARLALETLGPVASTGANTAEELAVALIKSDSDHVYVGARYPSRWFRETLVAVDGKLIVVLDDPRHVATELIAEHHLELAVASRLVASSCASLYRCAALPNALTLNAESAKNNPAAAVKTIARHLDLRIDHRDIATHVADLEAIGLSPGGEPAKRTRCAIAGRRHGDDRGRARPVRALLHRWQPHAHHLDARSFS
jgi:hypothetical protein